MRTCTQCHKQLTQEHFYVRNRKTGARTAECKKCYSERNKRQVRRIRLEVLALYSGGTPKCACCGELNTKFLSIDHINNDGGKERKALGGRGSGHLFYYRIRNYQPNKYQVLCFNCNMAKGMYGSCHTDS